MFILFAQQVMVQIAELIESLKMNISSMTWRVFCPCLIARYFVKKPARLLIFSGAHRLKWREFFIRV